MQDQWTRADSIVEERLRQTEAEVKRVDFFGTLVKMATIALLAFLFGTILDQWIFRYGLPVYGRITFFALLTILMLAILIYGIRPLWQFRINPLYSAKILEEQPEVHKNSVINWLLLRRIGDDSNKKSSSLQNAVLDGVAYQAARDVERIPVDMIVDHGSIIRWGFRFIFVLVLFFAYMILSSKSTWTSVSRLALPIAKIAPPQSVRFIKILPGNKEILQGSYLDLEAGIAGVGRKNVYFLYSTLDGRIVDKMVPVSSNHGNLYSLRFPDSDRGMVDSIRYRILVGDSVHSEDRSEEFTIKVRPAIVFSVEKIIFEYPEYTGLASAVQENSGDIRALDGTIVHLTASSNTPLDKALFIPGKNESAAQFMQLNSSSPNKATISFMISREESSHELAIPVSDSYEIRCFDKEGNQNQVQSFGSIDILDDLPPTVSLEDLTDGIIQLPINQRLNFFVRTSDPDFGLSSVVLHVFRRELQDQNSQPNERDRALFSKELLPDLKKNTKDELRLPASFIPGELEMVVGAEYEIQIEVLDIRKPSPNRIWSEKKLFVVSDPIQNPNHKEKNIPDKDQEKDQQEKKGEKEGEKGKENGSQGKTESDAEGSSGKNEDQEKKGSGEGSQGNQQGGSGEQNPESGDPSSGKTESGKSQNGNSSDQGQNGDSNPQEGSGENTSNGKSTNDQKSTQSGSGKPDQDPSSNQNPENGDPSNGDEKGDPSNQSKGSSSSDNRSSGSGKGADPPVDPEANPGDAFEKILNHQNKNKGKGDGKGEGQGDGKDPDQSDQTDQGKNGDPSQQDSPSDKKDPLNKNQEEIDSKKGNLSEDPMKMPKDTIDRPSDPGSKRYTADAVDDLPSGIKKEKGNVDPNTKNFLTGGKDPLSDQGKKVAPDAHIAQDPDQKRSGTPVPDDPNSGREQQAKKPEELGKEFEIHQGGNREVSKGKDRPMQTEIPDLDPSKIPLGGSGIEGAPTTSLSQPDPSNQEGNPSQGSDGNGKGSNKKPDRSGVGGTGHGDPVPQQETNTSDDPHLKYTEKATSLALEYIEDQLKNGPDRSLLNTLGWDEKQLRDFLVKWKEMKEKAGKYGKNSKERVIYEESLRNIGLRDPGTEWSMRAGKDLSHGTSSNRENVRLNPPDRFKERVRIYHQGISKDGRNH